MKEVGVNQDERFKEAVALLGQVNEVAADQRMDDRETPATPLEQEIDQLVELLETAHFDSNSAGLEVAYARVETLHSSIFRTRRSLEVA